MWQVSFLTPLAALVGLLGLLPLVVFAARERRARRVRQALGLGEPPPRLRTGIFVALVTLSALTAVAAAQPVVDRAQPLRERTDAEAFFAFDTSRSMLAAASASAPTRLERARAAASAIRAELDGVPTGIAQFTDWSVPHLLPTVDPSTFSHVLERSVYVESLGSRESSLVATDLSALSALAGDSFFSPDIEKRLLVVFTDGESQPIKPGLAELHRDGIRTIFVRFWRADESIWRPKGAEPQYRPDPVSERTLAQAAALVEGAVYDEEDIGGTVRRAHSDLGEGPSRPREDRDLLALMPYLTLAAVVPLGFLLRHRNL